MYRVGQPELDAIAAPLFSGKLFRYQSNRESECARFERRWAQRLGIAHATMTASGSLALTAALVGLGIGPGDEVIVPAHTYMATATAVLAAGAIPVIVEIDDSLTLDPDALDLAVGPCTRAVIPVHMWGLVCDMDAILDVARRRGLKTIEDACQCLGGSYRGKAVGTLGDGGAFSFNYFKNLTCGEGGAVVLHDEIAAQRARCFIDSCSFFWGGKERDVQPFAAAGARASEIEGAMINAQLDRLDALLADLRRVKGRMVQTLHAAGHRTAPVHDAAGQCATKVMVPFDTPDAARRFAAAMAGEVAGHTRRHTYTDWDPVLQKRGAHHPALDPFRLPANADCRMNYAADICPRSLDLLARTVMLPVDPDLTDAELTAWAQQVEPRG